MAAGNHLLNGTWALLVIAAKQTNKQSTVFIFVKFILNNNQWPLIDIKEIEINKNTSPKRLKTKVKIPAPNLLEFL